jgi:hypothetical protein
MTSRQANAIRITRARLVERRKSSSSTVIPEFTEPVRPSSLARRILLAPDVWKPYLLSRVLLLALFTLAPAVRAGLHVDGDVPWPALATWITTTFEFLFNGDSGWYHSIVTSGYQRVPMANGQANWAFFPAYPTLIRLLGGGPWTGILVSTVVAVPALGIVREAVERLRGAEVARRVVALTCFFPTSYVLSAFRPESLFLLFTAGAYLAAMNRSVWGACGLAALATVTRPQGLLVTIPILWEYARQRRPFLSRDLLAFALPAVALALFSAHLWKITGNPLAWSAVQSSWGRTFQLPTSVLWDAAVQNPRIIGYWGWGFTAPNLVVWIAALVAAARLLADRDTIGIGAYAMLAVLVPLASGTTAAGARYMLPIFPVFVAWAGRPERGGGYEALLAAFAVMLGAWVVWLSLGSHATMG